MFEQCKSCASVAQFLQHRSSSCKRRLAASAHKSIGTDADLAIGLELLSSALAIKPTLQVYKEYILLRKHADPGHDLADEYRKALQLDTGCEWAHLGLVSEVSKFGDDDQAAAVVGK